MSSVVRLSSLGLSEIGYRVSFVSIMTRYILG